MKRKIRYGMVGGGRGSFIGAVHRMAAALDGQMELVCGAFSSEPAKSQLSGADLFLPKEKCYASYEQMIRTEASLPENERMDVVSIVTPNHMHFDPVMMALERGFHVICDKPMCISLDEARQIQARVKNSDLIFALTHNYTGYPMVKQARQMIANGEFGKVRLMNINRHHGEQIRRVPVLPVRWGILELMQRIFLNTLPVFE